MGVYQNAKAVANRLAANKFVAFERRREVFSFILADHRAHAAQTHIHAGARRFRQTDHVLDRLANLHGLPGAEQHAAGAHIPCLAL